LNFTIRMIYGLYKTPILSVKVAQKKPGMGFFLVLWRKPRLSASEHRAYLLPADIVPTYRRWNYCVEELKGFSVCARASFVNVVSRNKAPKRHGLITIGTNGPGTNSKLPVHGPAENYH